MSREPAEREAWSSNGGWLRRRRVRQGRRAGSNATFDTAEAWSYSPLAERFDVAVFSCDVGLAKPDLAIYRAATARLGADPAESVFVGDGADGLGRSGVRVPRRVARPVSRAVFRSSVQVAARR